MADIGFVYVLGSEVMPGIYKVGRTDRSPTLRARELSGSTSVPVPFDLLYYAEVEDSVAAEADAHQFICRHRVNRSREFFRVSFREIMEFLDNVHALTSCLTPLGSDTLVLEQQNRIAREREWKRAYFMFQTVDDLDMNGMSYFPVNAGWYA